MSETKKQESPKAEQASTVHLEHMVKVLDIFNALVEASYNTPPKKEDANASEKLG